MPRHSILINIIALLLIAPATSLAQDRYPASVGDRTRQEMTIEMPQAFLSGILLMARTDDHNINASIVNEFGISLLDFSYDENKDKIKLHSVLKQIDKWYIKRLLKNDLKHVLKTMSAGGNEYINKKRHISYSFELIDDTDQ